MKLVKTVMMDRFATLNKICELTLQMPEVEEFSGFDPEESHESDKAEWEKEGKESDESWSGGFQMKRPMSVGLANFMTRMSAVTATKKDAPSPTRFKWP